MLLLAALLALPVAAWADSDPLVDLLSHYTTPVARPADAGEPSRKLSRVEGDLAMIVRGIEAYSHPSHFEHLKAAIVPQMAPDSRRFMESRETALNAFYRTLAVVDYTWAMREPSAACSPEKRRARLLHSEDRLFASADGKISPWLAGVLGRSDAGAAPEQALSEASAYVHSRSGSLARIYALSKELSGELTPKRRAAALCERAALYEAVAALAPPQPAPVSVNEVALIRSGGRFSAGVLLDFHGTPRLLASARALPSKTSIDAFFPDSDRLAATVARADDETGLALLEYSGSRHGLALGGEARAGDRVRVVAHLRGAGAWSVAEGAVVGSAADAFKTDASLEGVVGSPVLDLEGRLVGIVVSDDGTALSAAALERWLSGSHVSRPSVAGERSETESLVTAARPVDLDAFASGGAPPVAAPIAPIETGYVPPATGKCVWGCGGGGGGGSSWSYNNSEVSPLGQAMARGVEAMFSGLGNALAKLFEKKPTRSAPAQSAPSRSVAEAPAPPPPPPQPYKPKRLALRASNRFPDEGTDTTVSATIEFDGDSGSKAGYTVSFTALTKQQNVTFPDGNTATTDSEGNTKPLRIHFPVATEAKAFDDLHREEQRHRDDDAPPKEQAKPREEPIGVYPLPSAVTPRERVRAQAVAAFDALDKEGAEQESDKPTPAASSPNQVEAALPTMPTAPTTPPPRRERYHVDIHATTSGLPPAALGLGAMVARSSAAPKQGEDRASDAKKAAWNRVNVHVQRNRDNGVVANAACTNCTEADAVALLDSVAVQTSAALGERQGFDIAVNAIHQYLTTVTVPPPAAPKSVPFDRGAYRLDAEIWGGTYPINEGGNH